MPQPAGQMPRALAERAATVVLPGDGGAFGEDVPALLAHPDPAWLTDPAAVEPAPVMLWMHGRTVQKELDPGRYLRWARSGIATCSIDLPAHGERIDEDRHGSEHTLALVEQAAAEVDHILEALADPRFGGVFDLDRAGIGGMSAGGMATLHRLSAPHEFRCAAVEGTAGDFGPMRARGFYEDTALAERIEPIRHLDGWRPIPFLALHSEADEWVPVACITAFADALRDRYRAVGADPEMIELILFPRTGAPAEHFGFGNRANDAKNIQTAFLARHLGATAPSAG